MSGRSPSGLLTPDIGQRDLELEVANCVRGVMTPPWGVPVTDSDTTPPANTPARSHSRSSLSTRRSETLSPTSKSNRSWSISPKKF